MWKGEMATTEDSGANDLKKSKSTDESMLATAFDKVSPSSSCTSGLSSKSLPGRVRTLTDDERKQLNREAFELWKKDKEKKDAERKQKAKEEQERIQKENKDKQDKLRQLEAESRAKWLQKKQMAAEAAKQKLLEQQKKVKDDLEEKKQFSKEIVAVWMTVAKNRSKPLKGGVFENPRIKFVNPVPWRGVLED